jgi:hypothetical protein
VLSCLLFDRVLVPCGNAMEWPSRGEAGMPVAKVREDGVVASLAGKSFDFSRIPN